MKTGPKPISAINRVLSRIEMITESGCWIWMGKLSGGYGRIGVGSRSDNTRTQVPVHHITYQHFCGVIPADKYVLHKCHNRCCCNPTHLYIGTSSDNAVDAAKLGRNPFFNGEPYKDPHYIPGVRYSQNVYRSYIRSEGKSVSLYYGNDFFEAVCARKSAESRLR